MKEDTKSPRTRNQAVRLRPVASRDNRRLKELRLAFRRAELTAQGECAIDGIKLLEEALRNSQQINSVFFSESSRPLAEKLMLQISSRTEALVLPNALFNSIVPSDAPQGVAVSRHAAGFRFQPVTRPRNRRSVRRRRWLAGPRQPRHDSALR